MLQVAGVTKRLGGRAILDHVSLACAPSEVVVIAGENGAGKSTLLRVISGLVEPDRFREDFGEGTLAPFFLASLSPIAIACFRLFTFRPEPLFSVPFFLRCIADFTFLDADSPYLAMLPSRWRLQTTC